MPDVNDLIERLRSYQAYCPQTDRSDHPICAEAALRITELQDEVVRLRADAEFLHTRRGQLVIERDKAREALNETIIDLNVYTDIGIIHARAVERRAALDQQGERG